MRRLLQPLLALFMVAASIEAGLVVAAPGVSAAAVPRVNRAVVPPTVSWPQFMFDSAHTGYNAREKAINLNTVGNLQLDYIAAGPSDPEFAAFRDSAPAVVNGVAYLGDAFGNLVAFPATGCGADVCDPLWTAPLSNGVHTSPAVDGGLVFVATAGSVDNGLGQLYAFRAAGCGGPVCKPVWVAQVPNTNSSPVTANGVVYIASSDGQLRAYAEAGCGNPKCSPLWTGQIGSSANASPAVTDGIVYVTSQDGLFAFLAAGCAATTPVCPPLWRSARIDQTVQDSGPTVANGTVYFASQDFSSGTGTVYAYAAAGCGKATVCTPRWIAHPGSFDNVGATMAVANGVLYASAGTSLYAFNANGCGTPVCGFLWIGVNGPMAGTSASPTVAGGAVFFPQNNGFLGVYNAAGCGQLNCEASSSIGTQPFDALLDTPVIVNGRLYLAGPRFGDRSAMYVYRLVTPTG